MGWGRLRALLAGGMLAGAASCGTATAFLPADAPPPDAPADVRAALDEWRDLPVAAERRPVVLTGSSTYVEDGDGSYAMYPALAFADPAELPATPASMDGYPVLPAQAALAELRGYAGRSGTGTVVVEGMKLGRANFWTDRGIQGLPAWVVDLGEREAYVLAVAAPGRHGPAPTSRDGGDRRDLARDRAAFALLPDERTLLLWTGAADVEPGYCPSVRPEGIVETRTAVALPIERGRARVGNYMCDEEPLRLRLAHPLGNRVVVSASHDWVPHAVVPCAGASWAIVPPCKAEPVAKSVDDRTCWGPFRAAWGAEFGPVRSEDPVPAPCG